MDFQNFTIWKINKFKKFYILENPYFKIWKIIEYFGYLNNFIKIKG